MQSYTGSSKKTQQVYIITKQGKSYTEEGMKYVQEQLEQRYNEKNELIFFAGAEFNKPKSLFYYCLIMSI